MTEIVFTATVACCKGRILVFSPLQEPVYIHTLSMSSRGRARGTARGLAGRGARSTPPGGPSRQPNPETLARLGVPAEGDAENGECIAGERFAEVRRQPNI